jgi:hypothetical protein
MPEDVDLGIHNPGMPHMQKNKFARNLEFVILVRILLLLILYEI